MLYDITIGYAYVPVCVMQALDTHFFSSATLNVIPSSLLPMSSTAMICSLVFVNPTNADMCDLGGMKVNLTLPRRQWAASGKDSIRAHVLGAF